ncbi:hypothetical protein [Mucilaginibacter sp. UYCu711]|uniref:hypothetical protein n=1 Tax=Mucilaginibacter sp. UYCu711 TaxID=3156339 RepID=UPI003D1FC98C
MNTTAIQKQLKNPVTVSLSHMESGILTGHYLKLIYTDRLISIFEAMLTQFSALIIPGEGSMEIAKGLSADSYRICLISPLFEIPIIIQETPINPSDINNLRKLDGQLISIAILYYERTENTLDNNNNKPPDCKLLLENAFKLII